MGDALLVLVETAEAGDWLLTGNRENDWVFAEVERGEGTEEDEEVEVP